MTLNATSLQWAVNFVATHSDGDLFPRMLEMDAVASRRDELVSLIDGKDLGLFDPGPARRFIVPKDDVSYRQATQLDPQDSIILSAIVHQFGQGIEDRRLPTDRVFSNRFRPDAIAGLYGNDNAWNDFWTEAHALSLNSGTVLYCDIADFYNQIYHHVVENQLIASGFPNQAKRWVISLLESTTAGVSRGVPIGPHGIHLIAEATLIPVDESLDAAGLSFVRFADDLVVFCENDDKARAALAKIASTLDKQQRLMLQRHKTVLYEPATFQALCTRMIEDRPISPDEASLMQLIKKYSGGNPYRTISYGQIDAADWAAITEATVRGIIEDYLAQPNIDYVRLRWFYRRLTQVGHPGGIQVSLENLAQLGPCFANLCLYLSSVQSIDPGDWKAIGEKLLGLLDREDVKSSEYFGLSILSLFGRNSHLNHFSVLAAMFPTAPPFVRREILLAARANEAHDWIREHKESYPGMDPWQQSAFIYCCAGLPADEKKYFINRCTFPRPFASELAKWSKNI